MKSKAKFLINIAGPTASGKTALAIAVAQHFHTEIISSDSRQCFKEISIGTAKPSIEELQLVKHHFIDSISVAEKFSAGDFEREALKVLNELFASHDVIVMAGGSGLYIKALIEGLEAMPQANEILRGELHRLYAENGIEALQERLKSGDMSAYHHTEIRNPQRLMRAIEIVESEKVPKTGNDKIKREFKTITIGLDIPRETLYNRIDRRVDEMMKNGLLDEAKRMAAFKDSYALQTVGYKELFSHLAGEYSLEEAVKLIKQHTRNYAKRQMTWFRKTKDIKWFDDKHTDEIIPYLDSVIEQYLN